MSSPLPSTQYSHTLKITTPTSECCLLISAQHSQTVGGHTSSSLVFNTRAPMGVCSAPSCSCCIPSPWHGENSVVRFPDNITMISRISNNKENSYQEKVNNIECVAQRTTYCSTSTKPRIWSLILEKRKQRQTPLSTSVELRWSRWTCLGSWELASQRTCHGHHTSPHKESSKRAVFLKGT